MPIDRPPDEVGMAHVAGVLLDHVNEEPSMGGTLALVPDDLFPGLGSVWRTR